jgi:hypothetical protein
LGNTLVQQARQAIDMDGDSWLLAYREARGHRILMNYDEAVRVIDRGLGSFRSGENSLGVQGFAEQLERERDLALLGLQLHERIGLVADEAERVAETRERVDELELNTTQSLADVKSDTDSKLAAMRRDTDARVENGLWRTIETLGFMVAVIALIFTGVNLAGSQKSTKDAALLLALTSVLILASVSGALGVAHAVRKWRENGRSPEA